MHTYIQISLCACVFRGYFILIQPHKTNIYFQLYFLLCFDISQCIGINDLTYSNSIARVLACVYAHACLIAPHLSSSSCCLSFTVSLSYHQTHKVPFTQILALVSKKYLENQSMHFAGQMNLQLGSFDPLVQILYDFH